MLGYLSRQPEAMDSLEGIAQWWIMREYIRIERERVQTVLDELITEKILEQREISGKMVYKLRKDYPKTP